MTEFAYTTQRIICRLGFLLRGFKPTEFQVRGEKLLLRARTPDLHVAWTSLGDEFDPVIAAVPALKHNFIIDAGGYIGTSAIKLARRYPNATVVTIEPDIGNFGSLQRNVADISNVVPVRAALMAQGGGSIELRDPGLNTWAFTTVANPLNSDAAPVIGTAPTVSIPELMRRFNKDGIDIIKIDIEGAEVDLFADRPEWVANTEAIFIELHDTTVAGCEETFANATAGRDNTKTDGEKVLSLKRYS